MRQSVEAAFEICAVTPALSRGVVVSERERERDQGGTPRWVKGGEGACETNMQACWCHAPPLPYVAEAIGL